MTIYLDDRAGSIELHPHLPKSRTTLCRLDFGDVAFDGKGPEGTVSIGIEYKKIPDLVDCMQSGRFAAHQLPGMAKTYDVFYLLIEGRFKARYDGILQWWHSDKKKWHMPFGGAKRRPTTEHEFLSWVTTMEYQGGCHLRWSNDLKQSARVVNSSGPKYASLFNPIPLSRKIVSQIEGVGWEKSKALAEAFPTVFDLAIADEKDLTKVPGVGKKLAQSIMKQIRGE
jgi:ERCC4-type nuclease